VTDLENVQDGVRDAAERVLRRLAGDSARLRPDQWEAIRALAVERRRALVVQRTGWGKSAVYFVATALLRAAGAGPTVIVSPLLALMRNQIAAAERAGIHAVTVNSANVEEWAETYGRIRSGEVDVLLVSPERLTNPDFRDRVLPTLAQTAGLLVVDEAHCISDWGHDFRPDYRRLRTLLADLKPGIPVLATTATANSRVVEDVADQLGTGGGAAGSAGALVLRGELDRSSLRLAVVDLASTAHRLAWLAEHLSDLTGSGIVYTLTVSAADDLAAYLRDRGHRVAAYSGQTDGAERERLEDDLLANRLTALVATSALGMGFDKPDLGFVIHVGAPQSPIAYYQQIGRAGRGVESADVLLLPGLEDRRIWAYFDSVAFPPEGTVRATLAALDAAGQPVSVAQLETATDLSRSRLEAMLKVLDVDGAVRRERRGWVFTGQPWRYDGERYARVALMRRAEQQAMLAYAELDGCRMQFLREQLDDPAKPCGRCDNCTGRRMDLSVSPDELARAQARLGRAGVEVAPRKQWPAAMGTLGVPVSGRIPPDAAAAPGRAVGRLSDVGWGGRLRDLFAEAARDQPLPADLAGAVRQVVEQWPEVRSVGAVVPVPSRTRPVLLDSLARELASALRVPVVDALAHTAAQAAAGGANSARRVRAVWGTLAVPDPLADAVRGRDVLLVDDRIATGWTATIAALLLRQAGAGAVLPFVLALR